ncbi:MAG: hypothetical protein ABIY70_25685 [Capsulimonas sp.]|uniref:hypothetical protein n=1 Tax=Capsulimonas sp. TaxID=2494211 RepID=UPI003266F6D4
MRVRGFIYIEALMVILVLVALMAIIAADQRASMQQTQNGLRERRAEAAARSAVAYALATLQTADVNQVTQNDAWGQLGDNGGTSYDVTDGSTFRLEIVDTGSMVNVNTATTAQLQLLPLTLEQVDCLLDWRETTTQPRADGAKDQYYNALTQPYNTHLGQLNTLDELLLIKNWTGSMLYQPQTTVTTSAQPIVDEAGNTLPLASVLTVDSGAADTRADGSARIDFSQRGITPATLRNAGISPPTAALMAQRAPFTSFQTLFRQVPMNANDQQIVLNVAKFSTVSRAAGKINLNTASQSVLMTIPNMTQSIAATLITQQNSGYTSLGQLATTLLLTQEQLAEFADYFTIGGDTWIIRAYGVSGGVGSAVEATVRVASSAPQIINWRQLNTPSIPVWWDWSADSTSTLDAVSITNTTTTSTTTTNSGGAQ